MSEIKDLWGQVDIKSFDSSPLRLLQKQANLIAEKTQGYLEGEVTITYDEEIIYHTLYIIAPMMQNYRYALLKTASSSKPYPIFIYDNSIDDEAISVQSRRLVNNPFGVNPAFLVNLSKLVSSADLEYVGISIPEPDIKANNYKEFEKGIHQILSSSNTTAVIHSLLAQSNSDE